MATIDLPAVDSDVSVTVTAMNVFGSGSISNVSMDKISELYIRTSDVYHENFLYHISQLLIFTI